MEQPLFELYFDDSCKSLGVVQEGFSNTLRNIWNSIVTFFRTLWTNIVKMYNNAINTIKNWFKRILGVDKIEKENVDLKSQVQSMKLDEEKYKKDLADANAKLKETEEQIKGLDKLVFDKEYEKNAQAVRANNFEKKSQELEKEKKCLEKYIEYVKVANTPCNVSIDKYRYREIIQLIQKSNDTTIELCKKAVQIITDLKDSKSFDEFANRVPGVDPRYLDYRSLSLAYIGGFDEIDNHDANLKMLSHIDFTPILAKNLKYAFEDCVEFTNMLQIEYMKLKKVNIEKEIPEYSNDSNNTTFDKETINMVNGAIRDITFYAKKYQKANQDIISRMMNMIGSFTNLYKNIMDINFSLDYNYFRTEYLDEDGEYTPEIKTAIDAVRRFR